MAVTFTLGRFPQSGELKEACSLPFACIVQPFADVQHLPFDNTPTLHAADVGRCNECYAYINHYCHFSLYGWTCALCGGYNDKSISNRRYARDMGRQQAAELRRGAVEMLCSSFAQTASPWLQAGQGESGEVVGQPMYVAMVDLTCDVDFLELAKSGLLAALEAIPPASLFGLTTFSRRIGLYDTQSQHPSIKYVHMSGSGKEARGAPPPLDLEEALPLQHMLAPVSSCKQCIAEAIDSLEPDAASSSAGSAEADSNLGSRSFGAALQAVLRCMGRAAPGPNAADARQTSNGSASTSGRTPEAANTNFAGARLMAFLAGPPDRGPGSVLRRKRPPSPLVPPPMTDISYTSLALGLQPSPQEAMSRDSDSDPNQPLQAEPDPAAKQFYEEAAAAAAALGVCVDVYAASDEGMGLAYIQPLASVSGGALLLYPSIENAALPQDIYRRLSSPLALEGMVRIRTSPEFKVSRAYGQLFQDEEYDNLVHINACSPHSAFAFDFQFTSAGGFATTTDSPPMLQVVFQYSLLVATKEGANNGEQQHSNGDAQRIRYFVERRMRVITKALHVAQDPAAVYQHASPACILCILMHKIGRASIEEGVWNARQLLQDWLVRALANYNTNTWPKPTDGVPLQIDATFEGAETLQALPRLVYALLRSPLLGEHPHHHPDTRTAVHLLWSSLPAEDLQTAVYPCLSSYQDPDTQAYSRHSLSRAALVTAGAPIFLLDTFSQLVLYYVEGYPASIPFPPPQSSLLRKTIQALKQHRQVTPQLKMLRGGVDNVSDFTDNLIEEPDAMFSSQNRQAMIGLVSFLEQVKFEIHQFIEHKM